MPPTRRKRWNQCENHASKVLAVQIRGHWYVITWYYFVARKRIGMNPCQNEHRPEQHRGTWSKQKRYTTNTAKPLPTPRRIGRTWKTEEKTGRKTCSYAQLPWQRWGPSADRYSAADMHFQVRIPCTPVKTPAHTIPKITHQMKTSHATCKFTPRRRQNLRMQRMRRTNIRDI